MEMPMYSRRPRRMMSAVCSPPPPTTTGMMPHLHDHPAAPAEAVDLMFNSDRYYHGQRQRVRQQHPGQFYGTVTATPFPECAYPLSYYSRGGGGGPIGYNGGGGLHGSGGSSSRDSLVNGNYYAGYPRQQQQVHMAPYPYPPYYIQVL
ncbi:hypothetical protein BV898_04919 [Hypsibius exemplaris]|uniref:Uncharacterized protein n=1 Tax=Hypsibius exemplaris TaxID=2072580 RepID=A0A1W0X135_HYPEX|nr:hypothetical protein BV898_04919 [Hypsibius exemplaris]